MHELFDCIIDVSIPVWCDLEQYFEMIVESVIKFQFQYGAIWSESLEGQRLATYLVSIPVWCDLEEFYFDTFTEDEIGFNSSMVRFGDFIKK